ncbi:hypothetical protein [Paenibacillus thermotolerans]|uniref:hypothetical protein n=1 Tax=Paenibacillus thermotolerans TaxID=3027807 RepID=UPI00236800C8|nr:MULTISPECIES: hypothetical protein [unclassified Paenibacillus]
MAGCGVWNYRSVTENVFKALRSQASKEGYKIPNAPAGEFVIQAAGMSIPFKYSWNKGGGMLQLQCTRKPLLISCDMVKSFADKIIRQAGGTPV